MATFRTRISGPGSPYDLVLVVNQGSQSVSGNYSNVSWELYIQKISGYGYWANGSYSWSVNIGGVSRSGSGSGYNFENYSKLSLGSGSVRINHNSNGTKSISASGRWNGLGSLNATNVSGTLGLKTIPRESKITGLSVNSRTMNSITYSWSADKAVSQISYRHSGGSWNTVNASGTSGSFTVTGLRPAQTITVELQVKNKDSGLWSSSWTRQGSTYREATPTNAPGFTITPGGSTNVTVNISRESGSTKSVVALEYWGDNQQWNTLYTSGRVDTSITIPINSTHMNTLLSNRRSSKTMSIRYRVDSYWGSGGGKLGNSKYSSQATATISSSAGPTLGSLSYADTNSTIYNITGNRQIILQNHSHLGVTASAANARYHASLARIQLSVAGKSTSVNLSGTSMSARTLNVGTVNITGNTSATVTVTDSRGFTASKSITVTGEAYQNPTIVSLVPERQYGYEEPTYLRATVRGSKVNGKNKIEMRYRVRQVGGSWGAYQTLDLGGTTNSGNLWQHSVRQYISEYPNDREYDFEGQVKDKIIGWSNTTIGRLPRGVPLLKFMETKIEAGVVFDAKKGVYIPDTRDENNTPAWYHSNYPSSSTTEFKRRERIGLGDHGYGTYVSLTTITRWTDTSGGEVVQVALGDGGNMSIRSGSGTTWGPWSRQGYQGILPPGDTTRKEYWHNLAEGRYWHPDTSGVQNTPTSYGYVELIKSVSKTEFVAEYFAQATGSTYKISGNANTISGWKEYMDSSKVADYIKARQGGYDSQWEEYASGRIVQRRYVVGTVNANTTSTIYVSLPKSIAGINAVIQATVRSANKNAANLTLVRAIESGGNGVNVMIRNDRNESQQAEVYVTVDGYPR